MGDVAVDVLDLGQVPLGDVDQLWRLHLAGQSWVTVLGWQVVILVMILHGETKQVERKREEPSGKEMSQTIASSAHQTGLVLLKHAYDGDQC